VRAPIESARQLIDLLIDGTVRMSSVIRSRPQDKMALLTKAVERSIKRYREADVLKVPAAAIWLWARGMTSAKGSSFQRSQPQNEWPLRGCGLTVIRPSTNGSKQPSSDSGRRLGRPLLAVQRLATLARLCGRRNALSLTRA